MDFSKHLVYIEQIAEETQRPIQLVAPLYEAVLSDLETDARIQHYLPIFVCKRVKSILKASIRHLH